jgi:hypothetical protein
MVAMDGVNPEAPVIVALSNQLAEPRKQGLWVAVGSGFLMLHLAPRESEFRGEVV